MPAPIPALSRSLPHAPPPRQRHPLPGGIAPGLAHGRAHEFCGPSRVALAVTTLALSDGPVIWILPAWLPERPYACGLQRHIHPNRLILIPCRRPEDIQWAAEESLRSGAVPVVMAEYPTPPGLTAVRRLHLAAESPGATGHALPLALILTPGQGGAAGVESRWHARPLPALSALCEEQPVVLRVSRLRARDAPPAAWALTATPGQPQIAAPLPPDMA
ncbi:MAG: hypothetical protein MUF74_02160 [Cypionkella sp.]|nr:hypothetical protein [Cypionkella sp.]